MLEADGGARRGGRLPRGPTAAPETRGPGRGPRGRSPAHADPPRRHAGGDGPAGPARARARAVPGRRAGPHQRPRRRARASASRTSRRCWTPACDVYSTVNVQHLESLNDSVAELTGTRVRETFPDSVLRVGRPGGPGRRDARDAGRAPARGQGLPARARGDGAGRFFRVAEPAGAARDRAAPGGRERRAGPRRAGGRGHAPGPAQRRRPGGGRARAGAGGAAARRASGWCAGPGAPPSGWARSWTCCGWRAPTATPPTPSRTS